MMSGQEEELKGENSPSIDKPIIVNHCGQNEQDKPMEVKQNISSGMRTRRQTRLTLQLLQEKKLEKRGNHSVVPKEKKDRSKRHKKEQKKCDNTETISDKLKKSLHLCQLCKETFTSKYKLKKHEKVDHQEELAVLKKKSKKPKKEYVCDYCGKRVWRKWQMERHLYIHTGEKKYICDICEHAFNDLSSLRTHRRIHTGEKPYKCSTCGRQFSHAGSRRRHERRKLCTATTMTNPEGDSVECHICGKLLHDLIGLHKHSRSHNDLANYMCDICNKGFKSYAGMVGHKALHEEDLEKMYLCEICGKRYCQKSSLDAHGRTHQNHGAYKCKHCEKTFTCMSNCERHEARRHKIVRKEFHCEKCGIPFRDKETLTRHYDVHDCDKLDVKVQKAVEKYQKLIKDGKAQKPFKCSTCDKTFLTGASLKVHEHVHVNHKPHNCSVCGVTYHYLRNLKRHQRRHDENANIYTCGTCGIDFTGIGELLKHDQDEHGGKGLLSKEWGTSFGEIIYSDKNILKVEVKESDASTEQVEKQLLLVMLQSNDSDFNNPSDAGVIHNIIQVDEREEFIVSNPSQKECVTLSGEVEVATTSIQH